MLLRSTARLSRPLLPSTYQSIQRYYSKKNSDLKNEFKQLSKEEQQEFLQKLKRDIAADKIDGNNERTKKSQDSGREIPASIATLKLIIPILASVTGVHYLIGYFKRQQPTIEATIIDSTDNRIIYEYEIYGKVLRRLQKIDGVKENLKKHDTIQIHYTPKNPRLSIYKPPALYIPWVHTSAAKEVEFE